jgi:PBP1b-binding outer membrane lipoprotein LpoB
MNTVINNIEPVISIEPVVNNETNHDDLGLNEYTITTDNLENTNINIDNNEFFKVYNIINTRIKDDTIKHLRDIFIQKKIRNDIDLNEMIDDEDEN